VGQICAEPKQDSIIVTSEKDYYELLISPGTEVTTIIFPNNDAVWVSCRYSENNTDAGKNVYVPVAPYVTTQDRLKLYEYMSVLGESELYCDIDSVIFVHKNDTTRVKTGDFCVTSQKSWRNMALIPSLKSLYRAMRFRYSAPLLENV
jgi:hypothetical protein